MSKQLKEDKACDLEFGKLICPKILKGTLLVICDFEDLGFYKN